MDIIRSPAAMTEWSDTAIAASETIALVPTMGFFHEGHASLMRLAAKRAKKVVVSLFVNPIQFGPQEDFARYPRDFDRDAAIAAQQDVSVLFAPETEDMYPEELLSKVVVGRLPETLCGANRPGHFEGVATVVAKLFNIVKPHIAVFGRKDFQQLAVLRRMVKDLNWDIEVIGHPIVREEDGLALSSRNIYLSPEERQSALCLYHALRQARKSLQAGLKDAARLVQEIRALLASYKDVRIEYVSVIDQDSLAPQSVIDPGSVLALAVKVGETRLIDNGNLFEEN